MVLSVVIPVFNEERTMRHALNRSAKGVRIYEAGISYDGRTYSKGKRLTWKDDPWAIYCIF